MELVYSGKVRDLYADGNDLIMVASDRVSVYDVVLPTPIPDKGRVLTALTLFWLDYLGTPNHLLGTDPMAMRQDLEAAAGQLPAKYRAAEAEPLQEQLDALAHRRGPQPLAEIIPLVLARLADRVVQSTPSESTGP